MKRVYVEEHWCIDCKRCEVACKTFHSQSKDTVKAYFYEKPEPQSRIYVEGDLQLSVAINCRHCSDPRCVEGCISGALTQDPTTGLVSLDSQKCVGCATCVSLCPFGCIFVEHVDGVGIAYKCDLCSGGTGTPGKPRCVEVCPNKALIYRESEGD